MNFDTYLETHRPNPRRAALLTAAAAIALTGTSMMMAAGWIAGKMSVARVDPPTVEYVLLSLTLDEPAPPPPPPPPPGNTEDEDEPEDEDDELIEPEDLEEPDEIPLSIPKAKPTSAGHPNGQIGGIPGGQVGGIPGGNPIGFLDHPNHPIATKTPTQAPVVKQPLSAVMARALYSPEPSMKLLTATKAARFDKRDGKNTTSFCINAQGKVVDIKTKARFPGDPEVDQIIRDTIAKWRFRPMEVGSKKVKTCTERTFVIRFK